MKMSLALTVVMTLLTACSTPKKLIRASAFPSSIHWLTDTIIEISELAVDTDTTIMLSYINEGTEPVTINNVRGSCGCTVPEWSFDTIAVGDTSHLALAVYCSKVTDRETNVEVWFDRFNKPAILTVHTMCVKK